MSSTSFSSFNTQKFGFRRLVYVSKLTITELFLSYVSKLNYTSELYLQVRMS